MPLTHSHPEWVAVLTLISKSTGFFSFFKRQHSKEKENSCNQHQKLHTMEYMTHDAKTSKTSCLLKHLSFCISPSETVGSLWFYSWTACSTERGNRFLQILPPFLEQTKICIHASQQLLAVATAYPSVQTKSTALKHIQGQSPAASARVVLFQTHVSTTAPSDLQTAFILLPPGNGKSLILSSQARSLWFTYHEHPGKLQETSKISSGTTGNFFFNLKLPTISSTLRKARRVLKIPFYDNGAS